MLFSYFFFIPFCSHENHIFRIDIQSQAQFLTKSTKILTKKTFIIEKFVKLMYYMGISLRPRVI